MSLFERGPQGPAGPPGVSNRLLYSGSGAPDTELGKPGDHYVDKDTGDLYGPKVGSDWGAPTAMGGSGGSLHAPHVTALRALLGDTTSKKSVLLGGYHAQGDGGGGEFFWDDSSSSGDNAGTIIVPTGSSTGRWVRLWSGRVNVKWFGAKGDGTTDDTAAIQAAIDVTTESKIVELPPGTYRIVPSSSTSPALAITNNNASLVGVAYNSKNPSNSEVATILVDAPGASEGCGVLVERDGSTNRADSTLIRGINFTCGTFAPESMIVIHAPYVVVEDCSIYYTPAANKGRWGILIASEDHVLGTSLLPNTTYVYADFWRISNCQFNYIGNAATGDEDPFSADGAAVLVAGSDSNGGYATALQSNTANVSFADSSLAGNTWTGCYSQESKLGFYSSVNYSTWIGCGTEDFTDSNFGTTTDVLVVGGSLAQTSGNGTYGAAKLRVSPFSSLRFRTLLPSGGGADPIELITNGGSDTNPLGVWTAINHNSPGGLGRIAFHRTSDGTTLGNPGDIDNGWWGFRWGGAGSDVTGLTNYALLISDSDTTGVNTGWCWFPLGFYIGNWSTGGRKLIRLQDVVGTTHPTTAGNNGDLVINSLPFHVAADTPSLWHYSTGCGWLEVGGEAVVYGTSASGASVNLTNTSGSEIALETPFTYLITARVTGSRTDALGSASIYHLLQVHVTSGTATIDSDTPIIADATLANGQAWTFGFSVTGNTLRVTCAGTAGQTVKFKAALQIQRLSGF